MANEQINIDILLKAGLDKESASILYKSLGEMPPEIRKQIEDNILNTIKQAEEKAVAAREKINVDYYSRIRKLANEAKAKDLQLLLNQVDEEAKIRAEAANEREKLAKEAAEAEIKEAEHQAWKLKEIKEREEEAAHNSSPAVVKAREDAERVISMRKAEAQKEKDLQARVSKTTSEVSFDISDGIKAETNRLAKEARQAQEEKIRLAKEYDEIVEEEIHKEFKQKLQYEEQIKLLKERKDLIDSRSGAEHNLRGEYSDEEDTKARQIQKDKISEKEYFDYIGDRAKEYRKRDGDKQKQILEERKLIQEELDKQIEEADRKHLAALVKQKEMHARIAQAAQMVAVVSTGLLTAAVAAAGKWAQKMEQEGTRTDVSRRWVNAMKDMEKSSMKIGAILADKLVPYLEMAADKLSEVASWVEKHPEIVEAGIKGLAVIATIASVVATLFKIVTMVEGISAAMKASSLAKGASLLGGTEVVMSTLVPILGTILPIIVAAVVAYLAVKATWDLKLGEKAGNFAQRQFGMKETTQEDALVAGKQFISVGVAGWAAIFEKLGLASDGATAKVFAATKELLGLEKAADGAAEGVAKTAGELKEIEAETKKFTDIIDGLGKANVEAEKRYKEDVININKSANNRLIEIERQGMAAITQLSIQNKRAEKKEKEDLAKDLGKLEGDYNKQRADIIRTTNEDIIRIQENTREQLSKLEEAHNTRVEEFTRSRNALGLSEENRDYLKQRNDISEEGKKQAAERKEEAARALADLKRSNDIQRAERIRAYNEQVAERKKAIAEQMAEIYKRMAEERESTIKQRDEMLAGLKKQYDQERRSRYEAAASMLKDVNMSLVNERTLKNRYYAQMLADVNAFSSSYSKSLASGYANVKKVVSSSVGVAGSTSGFSQPGGNIRSSAGAGTQSYAQISSDYANNVSSYWRNFLDNYNNNRASGGYILNDGIYRMGERNRREFVLSNETTTAAEKLVGGQMTQSKMIAALSGGGSGRTQFTLNDNRKFDGNVPKSVRDQIRDETLADVAKMLSMVGGRG